jgi:hypothetical protein
MKISARMMKEIAVLIGVLFLLAPLTVFAQDGFYVIPVVVNKPLKNVITVAKANGKFTDPVAAVNSITDASASNPYLVVIGPGVYTVTSGLQMKAYVDIAGSGENVTKITGAISAGAAWTSAVILGANNASLSSLTVGNTGGGEYSIALLNYLASPRVTDVTAMASGGTRIYGVYNSSSSPLMTDVTATASGGTAENFGVNNYLSSPVMIQITATATGGANNYGVNNFDSSPVMTQVTATASGGTDNRGVFNQSSSPVMTQVIATASGGSWMNYGVYNFDSSPVMTQVTATASGGTYSYGVNNFLSSNPKISHSAMEGGTDGLYTDSGCMSTVSQSTIIGGVGGTGTMTCVACDNGSGTALNGSCL